MSLARLPPPCSQGVAESECRRGCDAAEAAYAAAWAQGAQGVASEEVELEALHQVGTWACVCEQKGVCISREGAQGVASEEAELEALHQVRGGMYGGMHLCLDNWDLCVSIQWAARRWSWRPCTRWPRGRVCVKAGIWPRVLAGKVRRGCPARGGAGCVWTRGHVW